MISDAFLSCHHVHGLCDFHGGNTVWTLLFSTYILETSVRHPTCIFSAFCCSTVFN